MDSRLDVTRLPLGTARERRAHFFQLLLRREEDDLPTGPGGWIVPRVQPVRGTWSFRRYVA